MVQNEELINRIVNKSLAAFVCDSTDDPEDIGGDEGELIVISAAKFLNALTDEEARHIIRDVVIDTVATLIEELKKLQ